jgi:putative acetyltransferase
MLRAYAPEDLGALLALFSRSVHGLGGRDYTPAQLAAWAPDPPDREAWAERLGTGGVFVCERAGGLAGFVRVDAEGCLDLLYVAPEHARSGVARLLCERALAWARARGLARLVADVSLGARPFFERMGFRLLAEQTVERRGVRLTNLRMERPLA